MCLWSGPFITIVEQPSTDRLLAIPGADTLFGRFLFSFSFIAQDLLILALYSSIYSDPGCKGIILQCRHFMEYFSGGCIYIENTYYRASEQCFSKCGSWAMSTISTWEIVSNKNS